MSFSMPAVKRKVGDEHTRFWEKWEMHYFFVEHRGTTTCLICTEKVAVHKEYSLKHHYTTRHSEEYAKYQGEERANRAANLNMSTEATRFLPESNNNAAVAVSYMVSEMIAKAQKVNLSKSAYYRLQIESVWKRKFSLAASAFLPTPQQIAFLTYQVTLMTVLYIYTHL